MEDSNDFHTLCSLTVQSMGQWWISPWVLAIPILSIQVALNVFKDRFCFAASHKEKGPAYLLFSLFYCFPFCVAMKIVLFLYWHCKLQKQIFLPNIHLEYDKDALCSKLNTAIVCIIKIGFMYRIYMHVYNFILIYCLGTKINRIRITVE